MSDTQNYANSLLSNTHVAKPLKKSNFQLLINKADSIQNIDYQDKFYDINPEFDFKSRYNIDPSNGLYYSLLFLISNPLVINNLATQLLNHTFYLNLSLSQIHRINSSKNDINLEEFSNETIENIKNIYPDLIQKHNLVLKNYKIESNLINYPQREVLQNSPKAAPSMTKKQEQTFCIKIRELQTRFEKQINISNKFNSDLTEMIKNSTKSPEIKKISFKNIQVNKISKFVNQKYFNYSENFLYLEANFFTKVLDDETTKFYNEIKAFSYIKNFTKAINLKVFKKFEEYYYNCFAFEFIIVYFVILCIDYSETDLSTKENWLKDLTRFIKSSDVWRRQSYYKNKWKHNRSDKCETILSVINQEVRSLFEVSFRIS